VPPNAGWARTQLQTDVRGETSSTQMARVPPTLRAGWIENPEAATKGGASASHPETEFDSRGNCSSEHLN
jgi:hypothetical protein